MSRTTASAPDRIEEPAAADETPTTSAGFDIASLLGNGGGDLAALTADPQALIRRWLEQRQAAAEQQAADATVAEREDDELHRLDEIQAEQQRQERQARMRELRDLMRGLYAEVEQLRARNDRLAAALGACHLCFGDDVSCSECHGRGRPGAAAPDPGLFKSIVVPAIRRLREPDRFGTGSDPRRNGAQSQDPRSQEEAPRPTLFV